MLTYFDNTGFFPLFDRELSCCNFHLDSAHQPRQTHGISGSNVLCLQPHRDLDAFAASGISGPSGSSQKSWSSGAPKMQIQLKSIGRTQPSVSSVFLKHHRPYVIENQLLRSVVVWVAVIPSRQPFAST